MIIVLIVVAVLSFAGIGYVLWLLKNDTERIEESDSEQDFDIGEPVTDEDEQSTEEGPPSPEQLNLQPDLMLKLTAIKEETTKPKEASLKPKPSSILGSALNKLKPASKETDDEIPTVTPLPDLKEFHSEKTEEKTETPSDQNISPEPKPEPIQYNEPTQDLNLPETEEKEIEKEIEITAELHELKEKYEKLDSLFNEKSAEFEKTKESLDNELKNRKEFNKVKDVLEKELKDSKDKARDAQAKLNNTQTEIENQKKRNAQLDEKASKLEKDLLNNEDKYSKLLKLKKANAKPPIETKPEASDDQKKDTPLPQKSPNSDTASSQHALPEEEKSLDQQKESSPEVVNTEEPKSENDQKKEEGEAQEDQPKPTEEKQPEQTGGFKLDLSINDEDNKPKSEPNSNPPENSTDSPKPN